MNIRLMRNALFAVFALTLLAAPAAKAQSPPAGDDLLDPVTVKINASRTVKNAQYATLELPSIEDVSCDDDASSDHSVWFRFQMPTHGIVDIDSGGSLLDTGSGITSVIVMTLYRQGLTITEEECLYTYKPRMVNVAVSAGYYLVRLSTDFSGTLQGPSQYRLSIRARFLAQFLTDGEFDEEPLDPAWKLKNAGRPPKIVHACNDYCFIHFNGAAGGKIQQTVQSPGQMKAKVGDYFVLTTYINSTPAAGSNIKFTLQLNYSDGTPPTKVSMVDHVVQISTSNTTYSTGGGLAAEIKSKALKSIKIRIISPSAADVFRVHSASLSLSAGSSVRAPLPVPPGP